MDGVLHSRKVPCEMYSFFSNQCKAQTVLNMFRLSNFSYDDVLCLSCIMNLISIVNVFQKYILVAQ
jgi:hypothetical protein